MTVDTCTWWAAAYAAPDGRIGVQSLRASPAIRGVVPVEAWKRAEHVIRERVGPTAVLLSMTQTEGDVSA